MKEKSFKDLTSDEKNEIITKHKGLIQKHITHYAVGKVKHFREDIEAEGWAYVFKKWDTFDPYKAARSTWIYNTFKLGCRNAVQKEYQKGKRQAVNLTEDGKLDCDWEYENEKQLLEQLPQLYQDIYYDRTKNDMSVHQIRDKYKLPRTGKGSYKDICSEVEQILFYK